MQRTRERERGAAGKQRERDRDREDRAFAPGNKVVRKRYDAHRHVPMQAKEGDREYCVFISKMWPTKTIITVGKKAPKGIRNRAKSEWKQK